jgi:protein-disulfide isomerase
MEKISIPIAIVIAGGLIAGSLYLSNVNASKQNIKQVPVVQTASNIRNVTADDHIMGNPNADIIIVEYSDTECPYCKVFHATLQRMMNEYGKDGKVAWVYRHFPIDSLHSKSRKEAEASECANELGGPAKFWEYLNLIYSRTNSNDTLDPAELPKIATAVGLDVKAFNACLSSGKYASKVEADYQDGVKSCSGNSQCGTPSSILITKDGTKTPIQGAYPYDQLKNVLDALLK